MLQRAAHSWFRLESCLTTGQLVPHGLKLNDRYSSYSGSPVDTISTTTDVSVVVGTIELLIASMCTSQSLYIIGLLTGS